MAPTCCQVRVGLPRCPPVAQAGLTAQQVVKVELSLLPTHPSARLSTSGYAQLARRVGSPGASPRRGESEGQCAAVSGRWGRWPTIITLALQHCGCCSSETSNRERCLACWQQEQPQTVPEGEDDEDGSPALPPWPRCVLGGSCPASRWLGILLLPPPPPSFPPDAPALPAPLKGQG